MKKYIISFCVGVGALAALPALAETCEVSGSDMSAFAALDYDAFNYGPDGWRKLSSQKCYYDAGASIISWLVDHEGELDAAQLRTQHYQAARNFALADRKSIALLQLQLAKDKGNAKLGVMNWNAYLDAFDAWLDADRPALEQAIALLEQQAKGSDGRKPNLDAARRFSKCFSKSYIQIEQDPSCLGDPQGTQG
jgi:hypothetical protein